MNVVIQVKLPVAVVVRLSEVLDEMQRRAPKDEHTRKRITMPNVLRAFIARGLSSMRPQELLDIVAATGLIRGRSKR